MMRRPILLLLLLGLGIAPSSAADPERPKPTLPLPPQVNGLPLDPKHLPWIDGETLTYLVSWTGLNAAEGTFTAHDRSDHWQFDLHLVSKGLVDETYPFTNFFWSVVAKPWRSIEYGEYRFEPKRLIKERTRIDYDKAQGTREIWSPKNETKTFSIYENTVDDAGSMIYRIRASPWKVGDRHTLYVYETNSEKQGEVECQAREVRAFGTWPKQPVLRIVALPTVGTHRKGRLVLWMTDDARHLVLHSEIEFRYGTFSMDLTRADKTLPIGH